MWSTASLLAPYGLVGSVPASSLKSLCVADDAARDQQSRHRCALQVGTDGQRSRVGRPDFGDGRIQLEGADVGQNQAADASGSEEAGRSGVRVSVAPGHATDSPDPET